MICKYIINLKGARQDTYSKRNDKDYFLQTISTFASDKDFRSNQTRNIKTSSSTGSKRSEFLNKFYQPYVNKMNYNIALNENISEIKTKINPLTQRSLEYTVFGTRVLPVPDNKYTYLAIPANEIVRNPNLNQNEGY